MRYRFNLVIYKNFLIFLFTAILFVIFSFTPAYAATASGVSVSAVIPENQVDKSKTYYDLRLDPGQKQHIQLIIRNGGNEPVIARVDINNASTGRNGLIQYNVPNIRDDSLDIPIIDIASVPVPQILIPAHGEDIAEIELNMPDKSFDGCVLGGVVVTADTENANADNLPLSNLQITNNYAYAIGLKITQNDNLVKPDMHLKNIKPDLVNYRPMVTVNLQNSEAAIIKGMRIDAQVYKKDSSEIFKQMNMPDVDMAPCSNFYAGIDWDDNPLEAGDYRLKMRAVHEDQVWEWDEEFTIQSSQTNKINSDSVYMEPRHSVWQYAHIAICSLILILLIAFLLERRQQKRKTV